MWKYACGSDMCRWCNAHYDRRQRNFKKKLSMRFLHISHPTIFIFASFFLVFLFFRFFFVHVPKLFVSLRLSWTEENALQTEISNVHDFKTLLECGPYSANRHLPSYLDWYCPMFRICEQQQKKNPSASFRAKNFFFALISENILLWFKIELFFPPNANYGFVRIQSKLDFQKFC